MKKAAVVFLTMLLVMVFSLLASEEGGGHGGEQHTPQTYFGIPGGVLKVINLVVFLGLLGWAVKTPVLGAFKARGERIHADLAEAKERRDKADRLALDIQARLDSIEKDVAGIIERAKHDGERQKNEIIEGARIEAERILASARGEVGARIKQARKDLTDYASELAASKAHEMLASSMTDADRRKVFADSVSAITESKA